MNNANKVIPQYNIALNESNCINIVQTIDIKIDVTHLIKHTTRAITMPKQGILLSVDNFGSPFEDKVALTGEVLQGKQLHLLFKKVPIDRAYSCFLEFEQETQTYSTAVFQSLTITKAMAC